MLGGGEDVATDHVDVAVCAAEDARRSRGRQRVGFGVSVGLRGGGTSLHEPRGDAFRPSVDEVGENVSEGDAAAWRGLGHADAREVVVTYFWSVEVVFTRAANHLRNSSMSRLAINVASASVRPVTAHCPSLPFSAFIVTASLPLPF
ncbi:MAG: hypothetical protein AAB426_13225 [Myxococcota bacterium]